MRTLRRILTVLVALVIILALVVVGGSFVLTRQPFPVRQRCTSSWASWCG
jgi:hypothetical protein